MRLFSLSGDAAFTGNTGLAQAADGIAVVAVTVVVDLGNHVRMVSHAQNLIMAAFLGDGTGGLYCGALLGYVARFRWNAF